MSNIGPAHKTLVSRILDGEGAASRAQRRAAFDNIDVVEPLGTLVQKIVKNAYKVTDDDFAAARGSGLNEDQIFEIVVCAAIGQATRQYEAALSALAAAAGGDEGSTHAS
jgi:hypothetical protein